MCSYTVFAYASRILFGKLRSWETLRKYRFEVDEDELTIIISSEGQEEQQCA